MRFLSLIKHEDTRWAMLWLAVTTVLGIWDVLFLNAPALKRVSLGFVNTFAIALMTAVFTLVLGWATAVGLHGLEAQGRRGRYMILTFVLNLARSVPQIVGILFGYIAIARFGDSGVRGAGILMFPLLALCIGIFVFPEMVDLIRERIAHFSASDFYSAMRVCGVSERRIVNFHILWRNSRIHIFNKLISVFGMAVFLLCSVDFIISVGLSSDVNEVSLPATLGGLLAKIDSKQDILAIGYTVTHPLYLPRLFFQHLQGVTVAFLLVFSLLCVHRISTGFSRRHRL
jgi:ABC-type dipeptide/oligopeptide/nickel transport system permease subunit